MSQQGWGVQYTLTVPTEGAAGEAAAALARHGHRLAAVREHGPLPFDLGDWYGKSVRGEELWGWWQVFSLAVYVTEGDGTFVDRIPVFRPYLSEQARWVADVARSHGGFSEGCAEGHESTLERVFDRSGLLHESSGAVLAAPEPGLSVAEEVVGHRAPAWVLPEPGDPALLVAAVVEVAGRLHGSGSEAEVVGEGGPEVGAPEAVAWLLDEDFAFGDPYESGGDFLADLDDAVAHQGTCVPGTAEAVPFLVAVATEPAVPAGARTALLLDLLRHSTAGAADDVALADRHAALGHTTAETEAERAVRHAVGAAVPHLLTRWDEALDVERFVLAALAAAHHSPGAGADVVSGAHLADLPAPTGTDRADTVALMRMLLDGGDHGEGSGRGGASPRARLRDVWVADLTSRVLRDVGRDVGAL
ncbi:hypothetical protein ABZV77_12270 [Streptomyces sp. NPDC004732]|uniref:hypothetical protein n=1 Tax=Streptomyces sp. NPDC004732 TaxID=3154290 RepID=UPI0033A7153A